MGASSCQTPGLAEPEAVVCTISPSNIQDCTNSVTGEETQVPSGDMIGWQAVSPHDYGRIKTHHQVLHDELNKDNKR